MAISEADLARIEAAVAVWRAHQRWPDPTCEDAGALIAEVRRLREDNSDWGQLLNYLGPYIDWQRIGLVAGMSPTEREGMQRVLARMGQEVIDDD